MIKKICLLWVLILAAVGIQAQSVSCSVPQPSDACETACISCAFSHAAGNNGAFAPGIAPNSCIQALQNPLWYGFIAGISGPVTFTLTPSNCQNGDGLQIALYSDCAASALVCDPGSDNGGNNTLSLQTELVKGQTYYLLIDGFNGDVCDYNISGTPAIAFQALPPDPIGTINGPTTLCPGVTVSYAIAPVTGASHYSWRVPPDATVNGLPGPGPHIFEPAEGTKVEITFGLAGGEVSVQPLNACFQGTRRSIPVQVGFIPVTVLPDIFLCRLNGPFKDPFGNTVTAPGTIRHTLITPIGCDSVVEVTIKYKEFATEPPPIQLSLSATPATCFGDKDGNIAIVASGGDSTFTYRWSNNATTQNISGIPSNFYTVTVQDGNGCTKSAEVSLYTPPIEIDYSLTPVSCSGLNDGGALVTITNGTSPYIYTVSNGTGGTATGNTLQISGLTNGMYGIAITDAKGCMQADSFVIVSPQALSAAVVLCENTVAIVPSGGTSPYSYQWSDGATTAQQSLPPGHYTVTVRDSRGCTATTPVKIAPVPDLCTLIEGIVRLDGNGNCYPDGLEQPLSGWFIRAVTSTGDVFLATTGPDGRYALRANAGGFYRVEAVSPDPGIVPCLPGGIEVTVAQNASINVNFAAQTARLCPKMTVDITADRLRRCFDNFYRINCYNQGTQDAFNVYVEVQLDTSLTYLTSILTADTLANNTYRFYLGSMAPNERKDFWILIKVNCTATLGQTHCTRAYIYPDTTCLPRNPLWGGGKVALRARCNSDSLRFFVKNIGDMPLTQKPAYTLIENTNIVQTGTLQLLAPGDSALVAAPANGNTWRLSVQQEPYAPGPKTPALSVEGCRMSGPFTTGFVTQFPITTDGPWEDIDCSVNVGSYDPNDKRGQPEGVGSRHYIEPGTALEYLIRFQNTGTDTAFNVVLRDTLSSWLDPLTIRPGAGSHPYQFELTGRGILVFKFPNIMLPDSNINAPASNGFVSYTVSQKPGVLLESDIFNRAAIYFDFNAPIFTNTTVHRVGRDFITVRAWEPVVAQYRVRVHPQPMSEVSQIILENAPLAGAYILQIFDLNGRMTQHIAGKNPNFEVQRSNMSEGVYVFKVLLDGALAGNGKLVVQRQ